MLHKLPITLIFHLAISFSTYSQKSDSTKAPFNFAGAIILTDNGISLVPTFSLGKPAVIFNLYMGKRLTFEPDLRFSLEGKPWTFVFWLRYKLFEQGKFRFVIGTHPGINFRTVIQTPDSNEIIVARRYMAGELSPTYFISNNVNIGIYYLYSRGIDKESVRNTHFLTLNSSISNIRLFEKVYLRFTPQFYYLRQNEYDGFFFTSTFAVARRGFPLSIMSTLNKSIESDIPGAKDFVWNLSLVYSFAHNYVEK